MTTIFEQLADMVDPDKVAERPELLDPVSLASHLDGKFYHVRAHLRVIAMSWPASSGATSTGCY